ncbi:hypothetical protein QVD99_8730 [Batrachochytrium dendrobatidis]|nr:hypothetical protein QVD99_8730 [Batrachochytrium dendrobatidis]
MHYLCCVVHDVTLNSPIFGAPTSSGLFSATICTTICLYVLASTCDGCLYCFYDMHNAYILDLIATMLCCQHSSLANPKIDNFSIASALAGFNTCMFRSCIYELLFL